MIWYEIADATWESGFYVIRRGVNWYTLTFTHPQNFRILGQARTLKELKADAERHAREHAPSRESGFEPKCDR